MTTPTVHRTPDERFADLPDFPYEPHYREWDGLRLAHVEAGEGSTVVLLHGEPTWSFLWRHVMAELVEAGHRCIAPDLPGFGRSDKPADEWFTYDRLVASVVSLFEDLDLRDVTLVVHDWGGPVGLRVATTEIPDRIARIVVMDSGLFTGQQRMGAAWQAFHEFVQATPDLPIGMLIGGAVATPMADEVLAAYEAPFDSVDAKGGARTLPGLIPQSPDAPGAAEGRAAVERLAVDTRPMLLMWADSDVVLPLEATGRQMEQLLPLDQPLQVVEGAGHFLQEDAGPQIGRSIAAWLDQLP
ncbi:hydrolase, alpha/beta domain protein [Aeromicrobium marinum DSM 15272]|uniref:Hydrolase, alpha/beta domain protein n=1 Tax=Aeromicrobium marinum DSM 15272 TaxID=585531 RepID=E2SFA1_9ACTN|nr:haloalkane dehalogenase [Aeromicrobium marinum]EFQ82186.1 hydrolase, alpha/beta domain protein [Aeromicrobium marinum DSM 15272]